MAWLPGTSATVAPARFAIICCAGSGIILSSRTWRYQLGLDFQAGLVTALPSASRPHGTWESAMKAAVLGSTSPAKEAGNLALSRNRYPSLGGKIGGTAAPGGGLAISVLTDSPL